MRADWAGAALQDLRADDLDATTVCGLSGQIKALLLGLASLEAELARRIAAFDSRRGFSESGSLDMVAWLRAECRLSSGAAAERVRVARATRDMPELGDSLAGGEISHQHAAVIARAVEDSGPGGAERLGPFLIEAARISDPGHLRGLAKQSLARLDPAAALDASRRDHTRRYLHLGVTLDGMFSIDGILDVEGGTRLNTALQALMGPPARADHRTAAQRRADALIEIVDRQLSGVTGGLPRAGGQKPHITVSATLKDLREGTGTGLLDGLFPLPMETVRRLSCDACVSAVLLDDAGNPLWAGRTVRTMPPATRRARALLDGTCRFPGCDRPVEWCDGHHLVPWIDGGETNVDVIRNTCRRHHRMVHEERWRLEVEADGVVTAIDPMGRRHPGRKPPVPATAVPAASNGPPALLA